MISDSERREFAAKMREHAEEETAFTGVRIAEMFGIDSLKDRACWNFLADLIEPDRIPDNSDKTGRDLSEGARDALLAVADDLEKIQYDYTRLGREACAYFGCEDAGCETCEALEGDDPCLKQAVEDVSRRIREALGACEACPDAPAAVDDEQTDTDARMDDSEAAEGYHIVDVSDKFNENIAAIDFIRENGGLEAVKARLMPEGMEWPRFEDGEQVKFGDEVHAENEPPYPSFDIVIDRIALDHSGFFTLFDDGNCEVEYRIGERVKRPAPKALDADGVEIRVGDRLYDTDTGCGRTVRAVNDNGTVEFDGHENRGWFGKFLTHRAPVLAADGKPLREGEKVYKLDDDRPYTLKRFDGDHVYINAGGSSFDIWTFPNKLTHQRPDSWERLEDDADRTASLFDAFDEKASADIRDLVRRAKALAERGIDDNR